ncbi:MAG TPA: PEPxxWA-CTERM sorting domain-containing protein, partial [Phenylobacterium sp.]
MHTFVRASALAILTAFGLAAESQASTLLSEDFNSGSVPGWTLSTGAVITTNGGAYAPSLFLDLGNNTSSTAILPTIHVVAGGQYQLAFDHGTIGSRGPFCCDSGPHWVNVGFDPNEISLISATENGFTNNNNDTTFYGFGLQVAFNGAPLVAGDFEHDVVTFTAIGSNLHITLTDNTHFPSNLGGAAVIDNVTLAGDAPAGVPEAATWGLMIAGFGLAGGALRRRP